MLFVRGKLENMVGSSVINKYQQITRYCSYKEHDIYFKCRLQTSDVNNICNSVFIFLLDSAHATPVNSVLFCIYLFAAPLHPPKYVTRERGYQTPAVPMCPDM